MISERKFATSYIAFWNTIIPFGDYYIHNLNKSVERFSQEVKPESSSEQRALIAEIGFEHFIRSIQSNITNIEDIVLKTTHRISRILNDQKEFHPLSETDKKEVIGISQNLSKYFSDKDKSQIYVRPVFQGCGIINTCEGDLICNDEIIEIKSIDRGIGIADVRQVLVYLSLQYSSAEKVSEYIVFVNPRRGVFIKIATSELAILVSGRELYDLLGHIVLYISELTPTFVDEITA